MESGRKTRFEYQLKVKNNRMVIFSAEDFEKERIRMKKKDHKNSKYAYIAALGAALILNLGGCSHLSTKNSETAETATVVETSENETVQDESGENSKQQIDLDNLSEKQSAAEIEALAAAEAEEPGVEDPYFDGAELRLLACADIWQNLSCVMKTKEGAVIVVDGGRDVDAIHLVEVIQEFGGHVDAWLLTHPHSDHVGAITEILNMDSMPISIEKVYYSFLDKEFLGQEQVSRRDSDLECYDQVTEALSKLPESEKCGTLTKGQMISVPGAEITVMNEPFACTENSFNNSSVAYCVEMDGKKILFLGDMGWQAGEDFLANHTEDELKADVLQMAHHGQRGVEKELYQAIHPEVCLWPTPDWLWDNVQDGVAGAASYKTPIVRGWMVTMGVKKNLCVKDGDQVLR